MLLLFFHSLVKLFGMNSHILLQVCPGGVTVLSGSSRVQYLSVKDLGVQGRVVVTAASVAEPFLLLHMSDGRASILAADPAEGMLQTS